MTKKEQFEKSADRLIASMKEVDVNILWDFVISSMYGFKNDSGLYWRTMMEILEEKTGQKVETK